MASIAALLLLILNNHVALASASSTIQCRSGWTNTIQQIPPSQINDGYCDCPLDGGIDEPNTGACSGSVDGMWTGIPPKYESTDYDAAKPAAYFACPQQPSLKLPMSRVNDGICDCCDGADESTSPSAGGTTTSCPDICDEVLAEERAALAKLRADYDIGSKKRLESISQYEAWYAETNAQLQKIRDVELENAVKEQGDAEEALKLAKVKLANEWLQGVKGLDIGQDIIDIVRGGLSESVASDVATFIISLCQLSAEASSGNMANDRCLALDRASLDLGLLWEHNGNEEEALPTFSHLDTNVESALVDYADKVILRFEGKDNAKDNTASKTKSSASARDKRRQEYSSGDDPYGDDWQDDHHDYHYDDDYVGGEDDYHHDSDKENESNGNESDEGETKQLSPNEILVNSLLDKVPIDRAFFKEQSNRLLQFSLDEENEDGDGEEESAEDDPSESEGEDVTEESTPNSGVDPMALQMVKSNLSKSMSNISRGEECAKSTAKYVASLMQSESDLMQPLAIFVLYHSKVSSEDLAELVYSMSGEGAASKEECSATYASMCPPSTSQIGERSYPPSFIVEAAQKRCEQQSNLPGVCGAEEEGEIDFPSSIPDGYYNYFEAKSRSVGDVLDTYFSDVKSMQEDINMIGNFVALNNRKKDADRNKTSLTNKASALEKQLGGDSGSGSKYGPDGELYILRDTCHSVESGKYEYEVCIFGKATQRDIGQKSGGTNLGQWQGINMADDGQRMLKWEGGTKCWNGPVRSAEVVVTCGAETKLLTADEPETCRYVFTMESPTGCDEQFKVKNSL